MAWIIFDQKSTDTVELIWNVVKKVTNSRMQLVKCTFHTKVQWWQAAKRIFHPHQANKKSAKSFWNWLCRVRSIFSSLWILISSELKTRISIRKCCTCSNDTDSILPLALFLRLYFVKVWIFWEGHKIWLYSVMSNFKWKIFSNFVIFSEYPNFTKTFILFQVGLKL